MHFKRKIVCSVVTAMVLTSCVTNDKYKAAECIDCGLNQNSAPTPTTGTPNPNPTPTVEVSIDFKKSSEKVTWGKKDKDEEVQGMVLSSQNVLVYSKWNNRLIVVDPQTQTISNDRLFLDVTGDRFSSEEIPLVDSTTGASEQILTKVLVNDSGTKVFSMLQKYADNSKTKGIGIYSDSIANGIPSAKFSRRNTSDTTYFEYPNITDMALSHDNTKVIVCGNDRKIHIFDVDTLNSPSTISTGKKMRSLSFSANDKYIFAGSGGLSGLIRIYDAESRLSVSEVKTQETPLSVVELVEAKKMIAIFNSKNGSGGNKVRIYDISDITNPTLDKLLVINGNAKSIAISPNGKLFAIAATGKQVNLFSTGGKDTPKLITLGENVSGVGFTSDTKLIVSNGTAIEYFDITVK